MWNDVSFLYLNLFQNILSWFLTMFYTNVLISLITVNFTVKRSRQEMLTHSGKVHLFYQTAHLSLLDCEPEIARMPGMLAIPSPTKHVFSNAFCWRSWDGHNLFLVMTVLFFIRYISIFLIAYFWSFVVQIKFGCSRKETQSLFSTNIRLGRVYMSKNLSTERKRGYNQMSEPMEFENQGMQRETKISVYWIWFF